ncbi:glycosyltransferase family 4 protein [Sphingomonas morindae]|uniref:Glycosyltransferase family 1 protein n=1 Tax=Sphingomonas morindae TaxID=1541170 RepID=A0ABY4XAM0_9SPHN|nr:glycosyltransferase family 1 protein [Sphingomonas morindae]USI73973.1 glycosyltransferase family 1 protein [Sphingomonas morindae]
MRIALISDAWAPQVNGVVRTLTTTVAQLRARGMAVETITPDQFPGVPCPTYPEIRLAIRPGRALAERLAGFRPDAVHIATEGPLGWAARRWCLLHDQPFTTSFHTRFPDYLALRTRLPSDWFWPPVRRFHAPAERVFVASAALAEELAKRGLSRTHRWSRGVDNSVFSPDGPWPEGLADLPRPLLLYVGRVAVEKNIAAFLALDRPGTKIVVGDGPARPTLAQRFPEARFMGALRGAALAAMYRAADLLVFPSLTDTFGLVMAEAMACGTPVAAFPVAGPLEVVDPGVTGILHADLDQAIEQALQLDRSAVAHAAKRFDWVRCTDQFVAGLAVRSEVSGMAQGNHVRRA